MNLSIAGQMASIGGAGGAGNVILVTANRTMTAADDGKIFVIDSNTADYTVTVPAGLPTGFTFYVYCNSTSRKIIFQFSGSERLRQSGSTTSAAGTALFDGVTDTGYSTTIRKVSSSGFANTYWGTFGGVGNLTLT